MSDNSMTMHIDRLQVKRVTKSYATASSATKSYVPYAGELVYMMSDGIILVGDGTKSVSQLWNAQSYIGVGKLWDMLVSEASKSTNTGLLFESSVAFGNIVADTIEIGDNLLSIEEDSDVVSIGKTKFNLGSEGNLSIYPSNGKAFSLTDSSENQKASLKTDGSFETVASITAQGDLTTYGDLCVGDSDDSILQKVTTADYSGNKYLLAPQMYVHGFTKMFSGFTALNNSYVKGSLTISANESEPNVFGDSYTYPDNANTFTSNVPSVFNGNTTFNGVNSLHGESYFGNHVYIDNHVLTVRSTTDDGYRNAYINVGGGGTTWGYAVPSKWQGDSISEYRYRNSLNGSVWNRKYNLLGQVQLTGKHFPEGTTSSEAGDSTRLSGEARWKNTFVVGDSSARSQAYSAAVLDCQASMWQASITSELYMYQNSIMVLGSGTCGNSLPTSNLQDGRLFFKKV